MAHVYDEAPNVFFSVKEITSTVFFFVLLKEGTFYKPHYQIPHTLNNSGTPLHHKPLGSPQNVEGRMEYA